MEGVLGNIQSLSFTGLAGSLAVLFNKPKEKAEALKTQIDELKKGIEKLDFSKADDWEQWHQAVDELGEKTDAYNKAASAAKLATNAFKLALASLAVVIAGVVTVINALKVSQLGAEIYRGAQQVGMSAQKYQEWQYVLQQVGIEASELTEVIKTLTEAQVDVINQDESFIEAFKKLGMSAEVVKSLGQDALWEKTIAALQNVENATERTALAYKIFGEDAAKLTTILNLSNKETQKLIGTYNQLGGVMSKELVNNSARMQSALSNLKTAWQGLRNTLAQWVLPAIISVVNWLTKAIVVINVFLQKFFNLDLTPATDSMTSGITGMTGAMSGYEGAVNSATKAAEKLKRTTMGFDELNIVGNPNTSAGDTGIGTGTGGSLADSLLGAGGGLFADAGVDLDGLREKTEKFFDKWEWAIKGAGLLLSVYLGGKLATLLADFFKLTKHAENFGKAIKAFQTSGSIGTGLATAFPKVAAAITSVSTAAKGAVTAVGGLFGGGVLTGIGAAALAIAAVASVVIYLRNNWDDVTGAVKGFFAENIKPKLDSIKASLKELIPPVVLDAFKKLWQGIKDVTKAIGDWFASVEWVKAIGAAFEFVGGLIFNVCAGVIGGAINAVMGFIDGMLKRITGIKQIVTGVVQAIVAIFKGDLPAAKKAIESVFEGVKKYLSGWYNTTIGVIVNFVKGVGDWFAKLYPSFEKIWTKIKKLFSNVGSAIANGITGAVKSVVNTLLRNVANKINTFIGWINAAIGLINKIPGVNIGKITKLEVPQLATGGIVTSETVARIGEKGKKEAVLPLEQNTGWMDTLANKIAAKSGSDQPINVHLDVDGTTLGWVAIRNINSITKQTGKVQLAW